LVFNFWFKKLIAMEKQFDELNNVKDQAKRKHRRIWPWFFIVVLVLATIVGMMVYKAGFTFSQMNVNGSNGVEILPDASDAPKIEKDPDRINILLLGLRGVGDDNGGLLTDTMMILSLKKSTGQAAMISVPRDLYVKMPVLAGKKTEPIKEKINFAYALGEETKSGLGLVFSKAVVSNVTGLFIDYAASVDFTAFKEVVDILGGVDIYLDKPFAETSQFAKEILLELPAGKNHLDGNTALYFVRSRFSTSDFDRARRQQKVLLAVKEKALSLGVLLNPVKIFELLGTLGRHVKTDMGVSEMNDLLNLANNLDIKKINQKVFDATPEGLLYQTTSEKGLYILLPVGENFDKIREASKNIFN